MTVGIDLWPHNVSNYAHTHKHTHTYMAGRQQEVLGEELPLRRGERVQTLNSALLRVPTLSTFHPL